MTDTLATTELTKLKAVADYVMDVWPAALGRDSLGGDLQFIMGDSNTYLMGENVIIGNAWIKGPNGEPQQKFQALGAQRRDETIELSVVISVRQQGAEARDVFNRCLEIGDRITSVQRVAPHVALGGLAQAGAALVPLQFEHLMLTPEDPKAKTGPLVRGGRLPCLLIAKGIRF